MSRAVSTSSTGSQVAVLASAQPDFRVRVAEQLRGIRWTVREVSGGAEAITLLEEGQVDALVVDDWLPDLEVGEFVEMIRSMFPQIELIHAGAAAGESGRRNPRRSELLLALQLASGVSGSAKGRELSRRSAETRTGAEREAPASVGVDGRARRSETAPEQTRERVGRERGGALENPLPEMVGDSVAMRELARLVRLVAPRMTTALILGPTGSGKELVAQAIHRLSARAGKPFVTLNCAAIPESLLEAELFGHTRGAFTGAVQSRVGRVEAANGGTLFLDEIGEMPLALQAKMLRFLENGEIQRIGGNETMRVDVRIVAATHQPLKERAQENAFRLDLYHRLAVFPIRVPALSERMEDIPVLARFFLERLGQEAPIKRLSPDAEDRLIDYGWPGNVRELAHVLERATILAEDRPEITADEIWF